MRVICVKKKAHTHGFPFVFPFYVTSIENKYKKSRHNIHGYFYKIYWITLVEVNKYTIEYIYYTVWAYGEKKIISLY